jgi:CRISPR-associated endonuclease/helicase Cas3
MAEPTETDIFYVAFTALMGFGPLSWQRRLYREWATDTFKPMPVIDLPTGMGKTAVMAIWLIARANKFDVPTRLIYVVDRRTVVDQATDLAKKLRDKCKEALGVDPPAISTLRGQLADNREWSADPSRPAIIIGTVDLIGSALLFSGYRSSFKRRPLEAGLLGQDSLLVLDEAHLSRPFEKLLIGHSRDDGQNERGIEQFQAGQGTPMRVVRMSATSGTDNGNKSFRLDTDPNSDSYDLKSIFLDGKETNPIVERFGAEKRLTISPLGENAKLTERLAGAAINLAQNPDLRGSRIVIFVQKPGDAKAIAKSIRDHSVESVDESGQKPKKIKCTPYTKSVEVLTGTMRGLERDELLTKCVLQRFLDGNEAPFDCPNQQPVFLISTSAGEVGFDLNADHMVCDAAPLDSMIQRLGRVNRRGLGNATIHLFHEPVKTTDKDGKPRILEELEKSITTTLELLNGIDGTEKNVSPKNIALLKENAKWKEKYKDACSPAPTTVELTDILLDAWSMTSITEPMPGRPEVAPWLRGIDDELPQTTIAWRSELDVNGFADLDIDDIEEWFDTHRILTHETLGVKTSDATAWLKDRWAEFPEAQQRELHKRLLIVDRAGLEVLSLGEAITRLSRKSADADGFLRSAEVIVPASFGGIRRGVGLLDPTEPKLDKNEEKKSSEEQEIILRTRQDLIDVADVVPARTRQRIIETMREEGETGTKILGRGAKPAKSSRFHLDLESDDDCTVRLVSYTPRFERPEVGSKEQPLEDHVCAVRKHADTIIAALKFPDDNPARLALELASDWHDHGKNREFFQRIVHGKPSPGGRPWPLQTLGKSGGKDFGKAPRGYRHEFGSVREFTDALKGKITEEVFDLAMHLIATHHGRGRPHFPKGGFDPDCESRSDELHTESIRRFARLQRKYGWWHLAWLENLLRCADALASADAEFEDGPADPDGRAS